MGLKSYNVDLYIRLAGNPNTSDNILLHLSTYALSDLGSK